METPTPAEVQQDNLISELKKLGIDAQKLPKKMPDELKEVILHFLGIIYDWDEEEGDTPAIIDAKAKLKAQKDEIIKEVKDWKNEGELRLPSTEEEKTLSAINDFEADASKDKFGQFTVKRLIMQAWGLIDDINESGTVHFRGYKFIRNARIFQEDWLGKKVGEK